MGLDKMVLDQWAPMSYKRQLAGPTQGTGPRGFGSSWMPYADKRRITAYLILRAYFDNVARELLVDDEEAADRREYGDAELIVEAAMSALLGEDQTVTVDGVEDHNLNLPDTATDEDRAKSDAAKPAYDRQGWLRQWAKDVRLRLKMLECEQNAVGLGDGVYLLAWSADKGRPVLRVYDPGTYFPVLDSADEDDYPTRVHLAWEEFDEQSGQPEYLRRVTYELAPIEPDREEATFGDRVRHLLRLAPDGESLVLQPGDEWMPDGRIARRYAWQGPDERSTDTCYLTDARWKIGDIGLTETVDSLSLEKAEIQRNGEGDLLDRLDLRIDFVPIVHDPNTYTGAAHYGRAALTSVLPLLDDLSATDTDVQAASSTTGTPPIGLSGVDLPRGPDGVTLDMTLGPGVVLGLGLDGHMDTVDTSASLAALRDSRSDLQERLSENSRMPGVVLGRVKPNEVPSGFALALGFTPFRSFVEQMRLVRQEKYPLLLKFVQRLAMAGYDSANPADGSLEPGEVLDATVEFGSYLPNDIDAVVGRVTKLYGARLISLETGISMLVDAGMPIDDVQEEITRIQARDFEAANRLADATGDNAEVRSYLGLEKQAAVPPLPGPPPVPAPPAPPAPAPGA